MRRLLLAVYRLWRKGGYFRPFRRRLCSSLTFFMNFCWCTRHLQGHRTALHLSHARAGGMAIPGRPRTHPWNSQPGCQNVANGLASVGPDWSLTRGLAGGLQADLFTCRWASNHPDMKHLKKQDDVVVGPDASSLNEFARSAWAD
jgi:hypothetical protein